MKDKLKTISLLPLEKLLIEIVKAFLILAAVAYLFYKSVIAFFLLLPIAFFIVYKGSLTWEKKALLSVNTQFKDGLLAISASLSAGYSMENAFGEALKELKLLYGEGGIMVKEFSMVIHKLSINRNVEDAIMEMAENVKSDDARAFAQIFRYAKRSGGDLVQIIKEAAKNIEEKQNVKDEIAVMVAAKQLEQKVMNVIPFAIIVYLDVAMPGMLSPLYHNLFGVAVMSGALLLYGVAVFISEKIVNIEM